MNLSELVNYKTGNNRLLGMDHGEKRIGLALSDLTWTIASPHKIMEYKGKNQFLKDLLKLQEDFQIAACVLGLPVNMNGSKGPQSQKVEEFGNLIETHTNMPVFFWDERWSTLAVEKMMIHADLSRAKRNKNRDALAAAYILQGILDHLHFV